MALLPPQFLSAVVALGVPDGQGSEKWVATGFLFGLDLGVLEKDQGTDRHQYRVVLVTNRHVYQALGKGPGKVRFNPERGKAQAFDLTMIEDNPSNPLWVTHPDPDVDVAAVRIDAQALQALKIPFEFFRSDGVAMTTAEATKQGVSEGDGVFVLGFPLGLVEERNYVVARQGCIARISDCLEAKGHTFLIDANVFPGNSGGPVILRPQAFGVANTGSVRNAHLVGIVAAYLPYEETAYSVQTGRPRITFQENSGLATVHTVDAILETLALFPKFTIDDVAHALGAKAAKKM